MDEEKEDNGDIPCIEKTTQDFKEVCVTFRSSSLSSEVKLFISREQLERVKACCSAYNTQVKHGHLMGVHNIYALVLEAGTPLVLAGVQGEGLHLNTASSDAKSRLRIAQYLEAVESSKKKESEAILELVIGILKVLLFNSSNDIV